MKILTAAEMREVDRRTIDEVGIPIAALMENAGRAVAEALVEAVPDLASRSILIVCGRGNNGGDGMVAARHLANRGLEPQVLLLGRKKDLKGDLVRTHVQALDRMGVPVAEAADEAALAEALGLFDFDVIVDAVFGTGFQPPAKGLEARAIAAIAEAGDAGAFVLAVDLPSGLDADRGAVDGPAVFADLTVTFAAPKLAHLLAPAEDHAGHLQVADISIPRFLVDQPAHRLELATAEAMSALLVPRRSSSHKGSFGHLLIVAGSRGKTGAAILAARAALRAGAGLVTVAMPGSCLALVAAGAPELMTEPLPETADGTIAASAREPILALLAARDALAIGPGLGGHPETAALVRSLLPQLTLPTVIDADGLNALAGSDHVGRLAPAAGEIVITPHPGEASRLLGRAAATIDRDRVAAAAELRDRFGVTVVLKGHRTVTAAREGAIVLNPTGNPGLATAGTGDVLTGVIGAFLAQGLGATAAAALGVYLHGLAGDLAAAALGEPSLIASDVIEELPRAFQALAGGATEDDGSDDPGGA